MGKVGSQSTESTASQAERYKQCLEEAFITLDRA